MKLDFIDLENEEVEYSQLIRLYDFNCDEAALIHGQIVGLSQGALSKVAVHELPFITPINGTGLILDQAEKDFGIWRRGTSSIFECKLRLAAWSDVASYMSPFLTSCSPDTFQWLDEAFQWSHETSEIGFLFSPNPNGTW
jgi:hypothetical protein